MPTILLSVQESGRQAQLTEALEEDYEVYHTDLSSETAETVPQTDLLILDLGTFRQVGPDAIEAYRAREPNVASPVLLFAPRSRLSQLGEAVWKHVDEVIGAPLQPAELKGRLRGLLRLRRYAEAAEEAREQISLQYKALFDSSEMGLLLLEQGEILEANARAGTMLDLAPEALAGRTLLELSPSRQPGDRSSAEAAAALFWEARANGEAHAEWRFDPDGGRDPFWVDLTLTPVSYGGNERMQLVFRDVTEEREREKRLRQMGLALEQIDDKVVITDREGSIQYVNEAFETITGYQEEEVLGKTLRVLQSGEHDEAFYEELWDTIRSGESFRAEFTNERKDGTRYVEDEIISPVTDEEGEITHFVSSGRDISERKQTEKALQDREAHLRGLANSIPGVVFEAYESSDGTYGSNFVSEQAEELLGISANPDGFHSRFTERIPDAYQEEFLVSVEAAFEAETPWQLEVPFEKPSGERIWLLGASTPQRRGEELVFNGVLLDVTERKAAELALQEERDRFATLFDNLPTPVVQGPVDEEGRIKIGAANEAFASVFTRDRTDVRGRDLQELIVPEGEWEEAAVLRRRLVAGKRIDRVVQRKTPEGLRDFRLQVAPRGDEGRPTEAYAIYTDVTEERHRRQRQRRQQKALLELTTDERVAAGDFDGAVRRVTERASEVLDVARVNVWLFDDEGRLRCEDHYDRRSGEHAADMELRPERYPSYFEALSEHRVIEVTHAPIPAPRSWPRTIFARTASAPCWTRRSTRRERPSGSCAASTSAVLASGRPTRSSLPERWRTSFIGHFATAKRRSSAGRWRFNSRCWKPSRRRSSTACSWWTRTSKSSRITTGS